MRGTEPSPMRFGWNYLPGLVVGGTKFRLTQPVPPMADLTNPKLIYLKGFLFLLAGLLASCLLILEHPTLKVAALLAVAVWCFARFYYFMFYVIERYVDPGYRFDGIGSFVRYLIGRKRSIKVREEPARPESNDHPL
jgi:hypothetical protein